MRHILDRLYKISGAAAGASILGICVIVTAQVSLNFIARIFGPGYSYTIPSYADFAGFLLAAASFLAMAYTLREGGHIRVTLLTQRLPLRARFILEVATLAISASVTGYGFWYLCRLVGESWSYGDMSTGIVAIPLWIPQTVITFGLGVLVIALVDTLVEALKAGRPVISTPDEV